MKITVINILTLIGFVQFIAAQGLAPPNPVDFDSVDLHLYYGPEDYTLYSLDAANNLLNDEHFKKDLKTVIFIHGYKQTTSSDSVVKTVEAYLTNGNYNTIVLDWASLAAEDGYGVAARNAIALGIRFVDVLRGLFTAGLPIENLHLVGHSLGGQMAGVIGKGIQESTNKAITLERISALDPSGPLFTNFFGVPFFGNYRQLSAKDAKLVDVIHSDASFNGVSFACGTVDFWPNLGIRMQPGCTFDSEINEDCSHKRSWEFWAESVKNAAIVDTFKSVKAFTGIFYQFGLYDDKNSASMGLKCAKTAKGSYFLRTNTKSPYSLGADGVKSGLFTKWLSKVFG